ncbi:MAG: hypothetical protein WCO52_02290 [bacterium]
MMRVILPSITTAGSAKHTWRESLKERTRLEIGEIALFLTGLEEPERVELYGLLETEALYFPLQIPFVHARSDMSASEYDYLIRTFGTRRFNLHPVREVPLQSPLPPRLRKLIYIENTTGLRESDLRGFAGVCLDVSHLEDYKMCGEVETFADVAIIAKQHGVGVSHVSAVSRQPYQFKDGSLSYAPHRACSLQELDYLKKYPRRFFGEIMAIELNNSLFEQLQIKEYIQNSILKTQTRVRGVQVLSMLPELG